MKIINLSSIANPISISVQNPSRSDYDRFIGLEHYDSGEPVITRFQGTELLTTSAKAFKANDILIARRNVYLKRAGIVFFDGITSGDSIILRLKEDTQKTIGYSREDLIRYIPFMLNSEHFWIYANKHADGMNSKRISKDTLLEYEFELPSIDEMRDISDKLWAAYRLKEAYKKLLVTTDEMVKSQFIEMFGDPMTNTKAWVEFGYIGNYTQIVLGTTPNSKNSSYWNGEIKWITPAEMTEESYYIYDTERHLTEEGLKAANLTLLPCRSVLFSTRAPIGKVGLVGSPMYCNQGFKNFVCGDQLNPVYLYYSLIFKREYLVSLGTGTTFKELSKKAVENLKIAVPPLILQNKFEEIYQQADKSKSVIQKALVYLNDIQSDELGKIA